MLPLAPTAVCHRGHSCPWMAHSLPRSHTVEKCIFNRGNRSSDCHEKLTTARWSIMTYLHLGVTGRLAGVFLTGNTFICACACLEGLKERLPKADMQRMLWLLPLPYDVRIFVLVFKFRLSTFASLGIKILKQLNNDYFSGAETDGGADPRGKVLFNLSTSVLFDIFSICKNF